MPGTEFVISQWLSQGGVGIFVRGFAGVPMSLVIERLKPHQAILEQSLGTALENPKFPLNLSHNGDVETEEDFEIQATWLHDQLMLYQAALTKVLAAAV